VFFSILLIGIVIFIRQSSLITDIVLPTATPTPTPPTHRDLWNTRGGQNYEMTVEVWAPPTAIVAQTLVIQGGKVSKNSIIGCDTPPTDKYPVNAGDCERIKTYHADYGLYTIDKLFDITDLSLSITREAMSRCHAVDISMFEAFPNADAMFEMAKTCEGDLRGQDMAMLSAIEYDPYYAYPNKITSTIPGAFDGTSIITLKDYRLTQ
jgi:hypothetical protein